VRGEVENLDEN